MEELTAASIQFHCEDVVLPAFFDPQKLIQWIETIVESHDATIQQLDFIFCSDEYLLQINQQHLDHDYYTDIITFPYSEGDKLHSDLFISLDRVLDNANTYGETFENELLRVMAHGVLHLLHFNDKTPEDQEKIRANENLCIANYYNL